MKDKLLKDTDLRSMVIDIIDADRTIIIVNNYYYLHALKIITDYGLKHKTVYKAPFNSGKYNGIEIF